MRQFLLSDPPGPHGRVTVRGDDFHYLAHVRRVRSGDTLDGRDRSGRRYRLTVVEVGLDQIVMDAAAGATSGEAAADGLPDLSVAVGLPKGRLFDQVVRQATEVGARTIIPLITERTVASIPKDRVPDRLARWTRIADEAVQQSGAAVIPDIHPPTPLADVIREPTDTARVVFHQEPVASPPLTRYLGEARSPIVLFIGPEGGFSDQEILGLQRTGATIAYLGRHVLRVETAVVYAVAAVSTILRIGH